MGNCSSFNAKNKANGSAFDRVTSRTSTDDDCLLYQLADYQKGGDLIKHYQRQGSRATEDLLKEQIPLLLYNKGQGQTVTRTDYLKWKYRGKNHVAIPMDEKLPDWQDHFACWNFEYRGSLGETLLHVLIICNSSIHSKIARMLIQAFPNLALDIVEGSEFKGASALHFAIAYNNMELIKMLVEAGAVVNQRAVGTFFLPKDQQGPRPKRYTDYEGLAYFGEYPLAWAACSNNESAYNLLIDRGASPNDQDSFGNMVLHMVVISNKLDMYGYALRHPHVQAKMGIINKAGLTPLTLSCHLGRATIFREMLELTAKEFWRYSNITCSAYPLNALDTILPDGRCNMNSALMIILNGTKEEHLDMLDGGIIQRLLEEKWKTFARIQFLKRLGILFFHLFVLSGAVYTRPDRGSPLMGNPDQLDASDITRFCFEITTILSCLGYVFVQQFSELKNAGFKSFLSQLIHNPAKTIFLASNILTLSCIPCRLLDSRDAEEAILIFALPSAWFFLMFFAGAVRLTGPFVTMIYSMITGDMFTFAIIYFIMMLTFSQAYYFLYKGHPDKPELYRTFSVTWMSLFQSTLGEYNYQYLEETIYPGLSKIVFLFFMIMVPILLLNMLIAMMGNTYALVIQQSEKEWVKQWAKIVIALERAVTQSNAKEYLVTYSIKVSGASDGSDGSPPREEVRGVMVIKSKNKTRARQRKGALGNWKHVGKVTIRYLKKRGITGEQLRKEIWDPKTPSTRSPNASTCATPVPCPNAAAFLLMDMSGDISAGLAGFSASPGMALPVKPPVLNDVTTTATEGLKLDNPFNLGNVNDLSDRKLANSTTLPNKPMPADLGVFNDALLNKLSASPGFIEEVLTPMISATPGALPPLHDQQASMKEANWDPLPPLNPLPPPPPSFTDHLDNSTQLSDLENEIIARTLLAHVRPSPSSTADSIAAAERDSLPPLFRPRLLDSPTASVEKPMPIVRQYRTGRRPVTLQHHYSLPDDIGCIREDRPFIYHQPQVSRVSTTGQPPQPPLDQLDAKQLLLVDSGESTNSKSVQRKRQRRHRTNVVAPQEEEPESAGSHQPHPPLSRCMAEDSIPLMRSTSNRQDSDHGSLSSSSSLLSVATVEDGPFGAGRLPKALVTTVPVSGSHNTSVESDPPIYQISGQLPTEPAASSPATQPVAAKPKTSKPTKKKTSASSSGGGKGKRAGDPSRRKTSSSDKPSSSSGEKSRPLTSTSNRISEAKATHFQTSPAVMNLNNLLDDPKAESPIGP